MTPISHLDTADTTERRKLLQDAKYKTPNTRRQIQDAKLKELFNSIGWDNSQKRLPLPVDNVVYQLSAIAQKRGVEGYECAPRRWNPARSCLEIYTSNRECPAKISR